METFIFAMTNLAARQHRQGSGRNSEGGDGSFLRRAQATSAKRKMRNMDIETIQLDMYIYIHVIHTYIYITMVYFIELYLHIMNIILCSVLQVIALKT